MSLVDSGCEKGDESSGMVCSGKPAELIRKSIGLLKNAKTTEYLALLRNVKADIIEISLEIVVTLQLNFGRPSRNSILPTYLLNTVRRL